MAERNIVSLVMQHLTCQECKEQLSDPRSLPCGHTVCSRCVWPRQDPHSGSTEYRCPMAGCNGRLPPAGALPVNHVVSAILDHLTATDSTQDWGIHPSPPVPAPHGTTSPICSNTDCGSYKAAANFWFCTTCTDLFCAGCTLRTHSDHEITPFPVRLVSEIDVLLTAYGKIYHGLGPLKQAFADSRRDYGSLGLASGMDYGILGLANGMDYGSSGVADEIEKMETSVNSIHERLVEMHAIVAAGFEGANRRTLLALQSLKTEVIRIQQKMSNLAHWLQTARTSLPAHVPTTGSQSRWNGDTSPVLPPPDPDGCVDLPTSGTPSQQISQSSGSLGPPGDCPEPPRDHALAPRVISPTDLNLNAPRAPVVPATRPQSVWRNGTTPSLIGYVGLRALTPSSVAHRAPTPSSIAHRAPAPPTSVVHRAPAPPTSVVHRAPAPPTSVVHRAPAPPTSVVHRAPAPPRAPTTDQIGPIQSGPSRSARPPSNPLDSSRTAVRADQASYVPLTPMRLQNTDTSKNYQNIQRHKMPIASQMVPTCPSPSAQPQGLNITHLPHRAPDAGDIRQNNAPVSSLNATGWGVPFQPAIVDQSAKSAPLPPTASPASHGITQLAGSGPGDDRGDCSPSGYRLAQLEGPSADRPGTSYIQCPQMGGSHAHRPVMGGDWHHHGPDFVAGGDGSMGDRPGVLHAQFVNSNTACSYVGGYPASGTLAPPADHARGADAALTGGAEAANEELPGAHVSAVTNRQFEPTSGATGHGLNRGSRRNEESGLSDFIREMKELENRGRSTSKGARQLGGGGRGGHS